MARGRLEQVEKEAASSAGLGRFLSAGRDATDKRARAREAFAQRKAEEMRSWLERSTLAQTAHLQAVDVIPDVIMRDKVDPLAEAARVQANTMADLLLQAARVKKSYSGQWTGSADQARATAREQLIMRALHTQATTATAIERTAMDDLRLMHRAAARSASTIER